MALDPASGAPQWWYNAGNLPAYPNLDAQAATYGYGAW
jgi:hypothetical protein